MAESTASAHTTKPIRPARPYEGFALFAHASGRWVKKINVDRHSLVDTVGAWLWPDEAAVMDERAE